MIPLEFTCTHIYQRFDLLNQTIDMMTKFLIDVDFSKSTLYINIDTSPHLPLFEKESEEIINKINSIFGKVIINRTGIPNFSNAIKWCWSQPAEKLFFHFEDDWLLKKEIKVSEMIKLFDNEKVFAVNLRAYPFLGPKACLLQSIYRKSFCEEFINTLSEQKNPENQLRSFVQGKDVFNMHYPEEVTEIVLEDIGRNWLKVNKLRRNHTSSRFINYSKG